MKTNKEGEKNERESACSRFYVSFFMDAWWFGCGLFFFIVLVLLLSAYREKLVWSRCLADLLVYDIFLHDCNS